MDDVMTPDRHGYVRVFVGGKYGQWRRVEALSGDQLILEPMSPGVGPARQLPGQLSIEDDENYDTIRLSPGNLD